MTWAADPRPAAGPETSRYLESVFGPGTRLGVREDDPRTPVEVTELQEVTSIRLPSGRLVAGTPWPRDEWDTAPLRELAERVPPGIYGVEAAWSLAPYEFMGEHFDGREVAGVRLVVSEEPVAVWEAALAVSDTVDAEPAFDTDTATGCFANAAAWDTLTAPFRDFWAAAHDSEPGTRDRATRDLVTFPANEGDTTTWLGRTASGTLAQIAITPQLEAMPAGGV